MNFNPKSLVFWSPSGSDGAPVTEFERHESKVCIHGIPFTKFNEWWNKLNIKFLQPLANFTFV